MMKSYRRDEFLIHPETTRLYEQELEGGETTRWSGRPNPSRAAWKVSPIVFFAIPWTAFSLFWIAGASGFKIPDFSGPASFFPLFGVPFVLIGLGMLSAPYWAYRKALKTGYFVTNRRVFIIERKGWSGFRVRTFLPEHLDQLERVQRADGSGDLIFDREYRSGRNGNGSIVEIGFIGIPEVREVEALIRELPGAGKAVEAN